LIDPHAPHLRQSSSAICPAVRVNNGVVRHSLRNLKPPSWLQHVREWAGNLDWQEFKHGLWLLT
jgi:hypothetical protein